EPFLTRAVGFSSVTSGGADAASAASFFGEAGSSLTELSAKGRARLADEDVAAYDPLVKWSDGPPLVAHRTRGRGEIWITTLPFGVDTSDFSLRPGFLAMLDAFVGEAKQRAVARRGDVGVPWAFGGAQKVEVEGPGGKMTASRDEGVLRVVPTLAGAYHLTIDGTKELRVATPIAREIDLRPRAA